MILSDRAIKTAIDSGDIIIDPFDPKALGTNSYDVHLAKTLLVYENTGNLLNGVYLDAARENLVDAYTIPTEGMVLYPGRLYLAATIEYTETHAHVPYLDGKSSTGRLGIRIHTTAGRGDVGFFGHWTMEIDVVQPVRVYAGMPIGQLTYHDTHEVDVSYDKKPGAKYNLRGRQENPRPMPSSMWKNKGAWNPNKETL